MGQHLDAWLPVYRRRHVRLMAPLTLACAAAFAAGLQWTPGRQLALLAAAVAVFGLPHGALDHLVGRRLLQAQLGNRWPLVFAVSYLALAAAVAAAWWLAPRWMLAAFLLYSAWHFGAGDVERSGRSRGLQLAETAARGALPITLPALFHPAEVTLYFNHLLPRQEALTVELVATAAAAVAVAAAAVIAVEVARRLNGRRGSLAALELTSLVLLFAVAPPLVSFLIYFCGWHSLRHLLEIGALLSPRDPRRASARLARAGWPLTLVTIAGSFAAWRLLTAGGLSAEEALTRVLFIGLAALTVPHMVLGSLAARRANHGEAVA